jgi:type I pantothenate kinase
LVAGTFGVELMSFESGSPGQADQGVSVGMIADHLLSQRRKGTCLVVGLTGAVAVGKTTLANSLRTCLADMADGPIVELVSTDGFLYPNAMLDAQGLTLRKGFPESYDMARFQQSLDQLRRGRADVPIYSHVTYDVDLINLRPIGPADIIIVEGLGFPVPAVPMVDLMIYLDAEVDHVTQWFVSRFVDFWRRAEHDPSSFYARFRSMNEEQITAFALDVWQRINLPNWREHIAAARDGASLVLHKSQSHDLCLVRGISAKS